LKKNVTTTISKKEMLPKYLIFLHVTSNYNNRLIYC
jgi:hypothetical protein